MSDEMLDELYDAYVTAFRSGRTDPTPFTSQLEGEDRAELETLIELFLDQEPPKEFNEDAYRESFSARMSSEVAASLAGTSGQLPVVLVQLRKKQQILVGDVEEQLADALGARSEFERGQVGDYYHRLEYGTLPARPVSDRVFEALAKIYRTSADRLRAAGEALGPQPDHYGGPVYARVVGPTPKPGQVSPSVESSLSDRFSESRVADEMRRLRSNKRTMIDDLFLGDSQPG